jgi:hypothetical protein
MAAVSEKPNSSADTIYVLGQEEVPQPWPLATLVRKYVRAVAGEIDPDTGFGFFPDNGGWRWAHIASGEISIKRYKTKGACKAYVTKYIEDILYAERTRRRRSGIYRLPGGERKRAIYRDLVMGRDPEYFDRYDIDVYKRNERDDDEWWWQKI